MNAVAKASGQDFVLRELLKDMDSAQAFTKVDELIRGAATVGLDQSVVALFPAWCAGMCETLPLAETAPTRPELDTLRSRGRSSRFFKHKALYDALRSVDCRVGIPERGLATIRASMFELISSWEISINNTDLVKAFHTLILLETEDEYTSVATRDEFVKKIRERWAHVSAEQTICFLEALALLPWNEHRFQKMRELAPFFLSGIVRKHPMRDGPAWNYQIAKILTAVLYSSWNAVAQLVGPSEMLGQATRDMNDLSSRLTSVKPGPIQNLECGLFAPTDQALDNLRIEVAGQLMFTSPLSTDQRARNQLRDEKASQISATVFNWYTETGCKLPVRFILTDPSRPEGKPQEWQKTFKV